jgi:hypothetical protein
MAVSIGTCRLKNDNNSASKNRLSNLSALYYFFFQMNSKILVIRVSISLSILRNYVHTMGLEVEQWRQKATTR